MDDRRPRDRYGRPLPGGSTNRLQGESASGETADSALEALRMGIAHFDGRRFFEAHECFEYVWKADDVEERDRRFWKGVTQVAVGCCHVQRENVRGALALLERASVHLRRYPSPHRGVDTEALIDVARRVADQVRRRGASPRIEFPRFPSLDAQARLVDP